MSDRKTTAARGGAKAPVKRKAKTAKRSTAARRREAERKRLEREMDLARDGLTGAAKTVENADLYRQIYMDWARGMTYADLAERHGLGMRRCQQIVGELRASRLDVFGVSDPLFGFQQAQNLVLHWTTAISDYAKLAVEAKQDSVRLGAMRDRDRALQQFTQTLQELGWLPRNLGTLRFQADAIQMVETLLDVLEENKVPEQVIRLAVEAMELRVQKDRGKLRLDMRSGAIDTTGSEVAA